MPIPNGYKQINSAYFTNFGCLNTGLDNKDNKKTCRIVVEARRDNFRNATLELGTIEALSGYPVVSTPMNMCCLVTSLYAGPGITDNLPNWVILDVVANKDTIPVSSGVSIGDPYTYTFSERITSLKILEGSSGDEVNTAVYRAVDGVWGVYYNASKIGDIDDNGTNLTITSMPFASPFRIAVTYGKEDFVFISGSSHKPNNSAGTTGNCGACYQSWHYSDDPNSLEPDSSGNTTYNSWRADTAALSYPFDYSIEINNKERKYSYSVNNITRIYNTAYQTFFPTTSTSNPLRLLIGKFGYSKYDGDGGKSSAAINLFSGGTRGTIPYYLGASNYHTFFNSPFITNGGHDDTIPATDVIRDPEDIATLTTCQSNTDSIKRIRIYEQADGETDVLIRDYVPVKNEATGEIYFYDQINDTLNSASTYAPYNTQGNVGQIKSYDLGRHTCHHYGIKTADGVVTAPKCYVNLGQGVIVDISSATIFD